MHSILKFYFKIVFVVLLVFFGGWCGYYKMNGILDIFLCDYCCRNNPQYTQYLTNETKVIGFYKVSINRCECKIIHKDIEWLFRKEMEKTRFKIFIDKWSKKMYNGIKLILEKEKK